MEKKRQVERLVQEMKEANLQSLTGSVDELRHPLDGMKFIEIEKFPSGTQTHSCLHRKQSITQIQPTLQMPFLK